MVWSTGCRDYFYDVWSRGGLGDELLKPERERTSAEWDSMESFAMEGPMPEVDRGWGGDPSVLAERIAKLWLFGVLLGVAFVGLTCVGSVRACPRASSSRGPW